MRTKKDFWTPRFSLSLLLVLALGFASGLALAVDLRGVSGFGMDTQGGLGGRVLKVTSLEPEGEGSLRWALEQEGRRVIVFEVGGVIDLGGKNLNILQPYVTLSGETAPEPGITLIRGGLSIRAHDVRVTHIRVRPGDDDRPSRSAWDTDAISTSGAEARDIHIDHCSVSWAVDENMAASGSRTQGPDFTSGQVTFSNSIVAEALDYASHRKGKHSKGLLVHDYVQEVAVIGNLFAHNDRRNPYFKAHATGVVVNNLMYNLGNAAVQLGYIADEWDASDLAPGNPQVAVVGNELRYGRDTYSDLALVAYQGNAFVKDNRVVDLDGSAMPQVQGDIQLLNEAPIWPKGLTPKPVEQVAESVLRNAGARPWERDAIDRRIVKSVIERKGRIIDSQDEVGGYPVYAATRRALDVPENPEEIAGWLESFIPPEYR